MSVTTQYATQYLTIAVLAFAMALTATGQSSPAATGNVLDQAQISAPTAMPKTQIDSALAPVPPAVETLLAFKDSDVKFNLSDLMDILQDRRHEGWVLAAYPDPKTGRPLIGAGVSLDLPEREHPQRDPLNPHSFIEPSSAELWQAAGLNSEKLQTILNQYNERLTTWTKQGFRKRIKTLTPEITDEDAKLLLRVSAIQAIYNAKGYCRNFDRLTPSQQMAMSQLVYQMGVNLQEFSQFLSLINSDSGTDTAYWKSVQQSLMQSQWARLYRTRAVAVIAMLDPRYEEGPGSAERHVGAVLRPAVLHSRSRRSGASRQLASYTERSGRTAHRARLRTKAKRGI